MRFIRYEDRVSASKPWCAAVLLGLGGLLLSGCGTPGAPQPPSLKLPERVADLTAERAGDSVSLHWTMPKKTTDHLLIQGPVKVVVCRQEGAGSCQPAGETSFAANAEGEFRDSLPAALASGKPRPLSYFVELKSPKGRSAGLSNAAEVVAGTAPGPIAGLSAEVRADGVALHWAASEAGSLTNRETLVRLHRKLLTPENAKPQAKQPGGLMKPSPEPPLRDLLVDAPSAGQQSGALDRTAHFGESYEYTAQRIVRVSLSGGKTLELAGAITAPVRADVIDTFPPAVPQGLAAVLVPEEKTIDLSWQPDTEEDLAGYIVYRAETGEDWKRISPAQPLAGPAFRDTAIEPGHSYRYAVSAIDVSGHESKHSAEASESVPNP
jgi:hypothetical protein